MEKGFKCVVATGAAGMADGISCRRMLSKTEDVDVHRGTAKPFTQTLGKFFTLPLSEFGDDLRDASRGQVSRQTGNDSALDFFP